MRVCFSVNLDTQRRYDNSSSILTANSFGSGMNSRGALSVLMFTTPGFVTAVQSRCVTSDSSRLLSYTHLHTNIHTHTRCIRKEGGRNLSCQLCVYVQQTDNYICNIVQELHFWFQYQPTLIYAGVCGTTYRYFLCRIIWVNLGFLFSEEKPIIILTCITGRHY